MGFNKTASGARGLFADDGVAGLKYDGRETLFTKQGKTNCME